MSYTGTITLVNSIAGWLEELRESRGEKPGSNRPLEPQRRPLDRKPVLWGLLVALFVVNLLETTLETLLEPSAYGELARLWGDFLSRASLEFEPRLSFANHQELHWLAVGGYSVSYFFVFPALILLVGIALSRRSKVSPFRVFTFSLIGTYLLSLPFFLLFPVIERWAYPGSGAILLSDLVSSSWIDYMRPMSGLDNCFPSTHTSFSVIVILLALRYRMRLRWAVLGLGLTVICSTFVLGIHWIPDIAAGTAVAGLAVALAHVADRRLGLAEEALSTEQPGAEAVTEEDGRPEEREDIEEPSSITEFPPAPPQERNQIFLSYRREDSAFVADAVYKGLVGRFGRDAVFGDVHKIPPGVDFRDHITAAVRECAVFVAVIGKEWHGPVEGGAPRLREPGDFVRIEVEEALARNIPLIPALVDGASMSEVAKILPDSLEALQFKNASSLRRPPGLDDDIEQLCDDVARHLEAGPQLAKAAAG